MTPGPDGTAPVETAAERAPSPERPAGRPSLAASTARKWGIVPLVLLAVAGATMMVVLTQHGIGLWEDSFDYITAARSLVEDGRLGRWDGLGNFRPLTHFPPGYPYLLALLNASGAEIHSAARWLNVLLFGGLVLLMGVALWSVTGSAFWGFAAAGLALSSEVLIGVHLWALTEPLYLSLALGAMLLLGVHIARPRRRVYLVLAAAVGGYALLTRYAGAATVIAGACVLVLLPGRAAAVKWKDALGYLGISCLPLLVFMARNLALSGAPTDEVSIAWHSPPPGDWEKAARTVLNWGLPDVWVERLTGDSSLLVLSVAILVVASIAIWVSRALWRDWRNEARAGSAVGLSFSIYGVVYLFVFLGTVLFVRRIVPADNRLLSPMYLALAFILVAALSLIWKHNAPIGRVLVIAVCGLTAGFQLWRLSGILEVLPNDSRGFASGAWRESETIAYVRTLPPTLIYSNEIQALYFLTGRNAVFIPTPLNPATGEPREDYEVSLARMRERLLSEEGALVLIDPSELSSEQMSELVEGLVLVAELPDGVVYRPPASGG